MAQAEAAAVASATEGEKLATKGSIQYVNPQAAGPDAAALGHSLAGKSPTGEKKPLEGIPGKTVSGPTVQRAARAQGKEAAAQAAIY